MSQDDKHSRTAAEAEAKEIFAFGSKLGVVGATFCFLSAMLVHFEVIRLYPKSNTPESLAGFTARVEFTLRYQTLLVSWLVFNIAACMYTRLQNMAMNPLQPATEQHITGAKNVLTNSMESFIVSGFSQLIFISYADPILILKYIPFINIVQFIGRITFFYGYPKYRSFGYLNTILPTLILSAYNLFYFGRFLEIY